MVVTTYQLNQMLDAVVSSFDNYTHIAVGSVNTPPAITDTTLAAEIIRKTFQTSEKVVANGTYTFAMRLATSEANGYTIREIGVFDASSGGTMALRTLTTELAKTSDVEVWIDVTVAVEVANQS